jgi:hypothetical protein
MYAPDCVIECEAGALIVDMLTRFSSVVLRHCRLVIVAHRGKRSSGDGKIAN